MEIFKKGLYYTRIALFIAQFFFLFLIISSLYQLGYYVLIFLAVYIFYVIKVILELLSKKEVYQKDIIYNLMQIGLALYIFVLFYRINYSYAVVVKETFNYFIINFGIITVLMLFVIIYSFIELKMEMMIDKK